MTRAWTLAALALAVVCLDAQAPTGQSHDGPPAPTGIIAGRVLDADGGAPVAGATVSLGPSGQPNARASRIMTDADGRFFFRDLGRGNYSLTATKNGYAPGALGRRRPGGATQPLELKDSERRGDLTLPVWRLGAIAGRVIDETGEPLVDVEARVFQESFAGGVRQFVPMGKVFTDDRGAYRFSNLMPASYIVGVVATVTSEPPALAGFARAQPPAEYVQTMTSVGAAPRSFDRAEVPAAGGNVLLAGMLGIRTAPLAAGAWPVYATTFYLSAAAAPAAATIRVASGRERTGLDITVKIVPTYQVLGAVRQLDGTPAAFHAVHLIPADQGASPIFETATAIADSNGAFRFFGVPAGDYIARVVRVPVPGGTEMGIGSLGGRSDRFIVLSLRGPMNGPPPMPVDPLSFAEEPVTVVDRDVSGISLAMRTGARVSGRAEFEGTADPPTAEQWRAMQVQLEPPAGTPNPGLGNVVMTGRVSEDGRFQTPVMWPGRYLVRVTGQPSKWTFAGATHQGRDISETVLDLRADVDGVVLHFTDHANKIDGVVQDERGQADAGAQVLLFPVDAAGWKDYGRTSRRVRSTTPLNGTFTLTAVPDGEYYLVAIPDEQSASWQNPAFLSAVVPLADRVSVRGGQSMTHALRTRRVQ